MERADEVLALREVHAGLAADRARRPSRAAWSAPARRRRRGSRPRRRSRRCRRRLRRRPRRRRRRGSRPHARELAAEVARRSRASWRPRRRPSANVSCSTPAPSSDRAARQRGTCASRIAACVTIATRRRPARTDASAASASLADDDVVAAGAEVDRCDASSRLAPRSYDVEHRVGDRVDVEAVGVDGACAAASYAGSRSRSSRVERAGRVAARAAAASGRRRRARASTRGGRPQPHDDARGAQLAPVLGVEHRAAAARDHERRPATRTRRRPTSRSSSRNAASPCACEDLVDRHAGAARRRGRRCRRTAAPSRAAHSRADRRLARAHQPDEHEVRVALIAHRSDARVRVVVARRTRRASRRRTCAAPPTRARARPSSRRRRRPPGTAVTSVRSLNDTVSSFVSTSTVFSTGRFSVASGFIATRATSRSPVVMPPSMPPARVDSRRYSPRVGVPADRVVRVAAAPRRRP